MATIIRCSIIMTKTLSQKNKFTLALSMHHNGQISQAMKLYDEILAVDPLYADALHWLGMGYSQCGDHIKGLFYIKQSIEITDNYSPFHCHLGQVYEAINEFRQAHIAYRKALFVDPENIIALNYLSMSLIRYNQPDQAIEYSRSALNLDSKNTQAINNLGQAFVNQHRFNEAIEQFKYAIELSPNHVLSHYNLATTQLLTGDLQQGWQEYEWRLKHPDLTPPDFEQPQWDGSDLNGRTLFLQTEQGYGDNIQFCRYVKELSKHGKIILSTKKALFQFMKEQNFDAHICTDGDPMPQFDVHAQLMSLPYLCKTNLDTIPSQTPYLIANTSTPPDCIIKNKDLKVGIAWAGNPTFSNDHNRSIKLEQFESLFQLKGVTFYSLQKEKRDGDNTILSNTPNIIELNEFMDSFSTTASLIKHLDLIISVDTVIAHLAAAMHKRTWILLPHTPDWRWMINRTDTPWYPNAQLFRQEKPNRWQSVIDQCKKELTQTYHLGC